MSEADDELQAIQSVISALTPLDEAARTRVLEYVFKRLGLAAAPLSREPARAGVATAVPEPGALSPVARGVVDIRSLREEKAPRSANEMAAVVAYYLSELAPLGERTETIGTPEVQKYFKQAGYPLPKVPRVTLANAAHAGYFDSAGTGLYRLNPVGYNLVVHSLPRKAATEARQAPKKRRKTGATKRTPQAKRSGESQSKRRK